MSELLSLDDAEFWAVIEGLIYHLPEREKQAARERVRVALRKTARDIVKWLRWEQMEFGAPTGGVHPVFDET